MAGIRGLDLDPTAPTLLNQSHRAKLKMGGHLSGPHLSLGQQDGRLNPPSASASGGSLSEQHTQMHTSTQVLCRAPPHPTLQACCASHISRAHHGPCSPVVPLAHTVVEPLAVVVEAAHTLVAGTAMLGASAPAGGKHRGRPAHLRLQSRAATSAGTPVPTSAPGLSVPMKNVRALWRNYGEWPMEEAVL